MPKIAITSCSKFRDYEEAVRRAGGEPVRVDPTTAPADIVRDYDGVLLTGGGDVLPSLYGEPAHPTFSEAEEPGRDAFELKLAAEATAADLPLFAVCRGIQVLNVSRGGTLVQDIPSQIVSPGAHKVSEPPDTIAHAVRVTDGSLLQELMGDKVSGGAACLVNSRHHQAVKAVGHGLVVTATAPDGVIEAVEDPSKRFCLGVQWHPENFWRTGEFAELFRGFVEAAKKPL
jgi:putative glutamine amidotransferase